MKFYETILKYPKSIISIILLITLFFAWQMRKLEMNNSIFSLMPEDHPSIILDNEVKHIFNSREMILIGLLSNEGVFNSSTLTKVKEITEKVKQISIADEDDEQELNAWSGKLNENYKKNISGILKKGLTQADRGAVTNLLLESKNNPELNTNFSSFLKKLLLKLSPVSDVISLAEVDNVTSSDWGLKIDPPMKDVPRTKEERNKLKEAVFSNEMFINGLVSKDTTGTVILVEMSFFYDDYPKESSLLFEKLKELVKPYRGPEEIKLAGVPMVNVYTSQYMASDLAILTPIVILVVIIVMFFSFRKFQGIFIPLSVVVIALIWTLGLMGLLGRPITIVVSAMPVMLIAIGIADGIHLYTEYKILFAEYNDRFKAVLKTMHTLAKPVIFTSLTTMAGFGSLATSNLESIKDFGIFTSFGVFAAMIFSLTFIPAVFVLMTPPREIKSSKNNNNTDSLTLLLERIGKFAVDNRRLVFVSTIVLTALSVFAITKMKVGSTMVGNFKSNTEIYQASEMLNSKFGGTEVMNIIINTGKDNALKEPKLLAKIAVLQDTLEAHSLVGYSASLADYVKRINLVMNNNNSAFNRIPHNKEIVTETDWIEKNGKEVETQRQVEISGRDQIAQYLLLYENAGGNDLEKLTDFSYSKANIVIQIRTDDTPKIREIEQIAKRFAIANFGSNAIVSYVGCASLCVVADDLIIPSQIKSLGIALLVVLGLLSLIFRSLKFGFIGLLPLLLTILLVFAIMSLAGIYLDAGTTLIASIVLGIGVDYSIHFLSRYRLLRNEGLDFCNALHQTFITSGRAIVYNSLAVAIGFLVLLLSSFWPIIHIGWLVAVNMIISALLTIVLIPAVLKKK